MTVRITFNEELIMMYPHVVSIYNTEDNMLVMTKRKKGQKYEPVPTETIQEIFIVEGNTIIQQLQIKLKIWKLRTKLRLCKLR